MSAEARVTVTDVPQSHRFEARLDGELAGYLSYLRDDEQVDYQHTVVDEEYEGMGVGGALARAALDDGRKRGIRVKVTCPFLKEWLVRHPEYLPDAQD
ncbi:putative GNAT family acetyltransferase [Streptacidiphilus sp. MAP12-16]|uniref:GNAT family N-acetyltransferase n=1 Tax=Streptacidiphilus sp. MAP12-16 TaxID=3156300 RepID=UPI0035193AE2